MYVCVCVCVCVYMQADLPYDSDTQSSRLQEVLNTCLEVETGLEVSHVTIACAGHVIHHVIHHVIQL